MIANIANIQQTKNLSHMRQAVKIIIFKNLILQVFNKKLERYVKKISKEKIMLIPNK
jgi:hypothetical protein